MAKVADIIEVARRGGDSLSERSISAGDPAQNLQTTAWLVHRMMLGQAQRAGERQIPGAEDGAVWYEWHGTLSGVLVKLQLAQHNDETQLRSVRRSVSGWLRTTGNAYCLHRTNGQPNANPSKETLWAVRAEFRETPAPADLPVLQLITLPARPAAAQPVAEAEVAPAAVPAGSAAPAAAPAAAQRMRCPHCAQDCALTFITRHVFTAHIDPRPLLLDAVQQRGKILSTELATLLSGAALNAPVTTDYVNSILRAAVSQGVIYTKKEWGGKFWYCWLGDSPASTHRPVTTLNGTGEPAPHVGGGLAAAPPEGAAPPVTGRDLSHEPAQQRAQQRSVLLAADSSPAGDELPSALDALDEALQRVRFAVQGLTAENSALRAYRDRVRQLLGQVEP